MQTQELTRAVGSSRNAILTLVGGVICQFALGIFYLWGSIVVYTTSYFRQWDPNLTLSLAQGVFPIQGVCLGLSMLFGKIIADKIGFKLTMAIFYLIMASGLFVASYIKDFYLFAAVYGLVVGICDGILYTLPLWASWKYYPHRKGLVSGVTVGGFGIGTFLFCLLGQQLVNPDNQKATIPGISGEMFYNEDVYSRVPSMLRVMALIVLILAAIGVSCIQLKPKHDGEQEIPQTESSGTEQVQKRDTSISLRESVITSVPLISQRVAKSLTVKQIIQQQRFLQLFFMSMFSATGVMFVANNYKTFGQQKIKDDLFLTIVGSIGMIGNGLSRCAWGAIMDLKSFKKVYGVLLLAQIIAICTLSLISYSKILYFLWVVVILACEGGHFALFPSVCAKIFGSDDGAKAFSMVAFGLNIGNVIQYALTLLLLASFGYEYLTTIIGVLGVISLIMVLPFNEKHRVKRTSDVKS